MSEGLGGRPHGRRDSGTLNWAGKSRSAARLILAGGLALVLAAVAGLGIDSAGHGHAQSPSPSPDECVSPVDISLVIDHTGSMSQLPSGGGAQSKLEIVKLAASGFLDNLSGG